MTDICGAIRDFCRVMGYEYIPRYFPSGKRILPCVGMSVPKGSEIDSMILFCDYLVSSGFSPVHRSISHGDIDECLDCEHSVIYFKGIRDNRFVDADVEFFTMEVE